MKLYHATYKANLGSIFEHGLGAIQKKNWDISMDGCVYFAEDMELAISFCEAADKVPDEIFDSGIVCLEVDSGCLLDALLFSDLNWKDDENPEACFLYRGVIAPIHLKVVHDEYSIERSEVSGMVKNVNISVDIEIARKMLRVAGFSFDEINQASDEEIFLKALSMNDCYGVTYEIVGDTKENGMVNPSVDAIIASAHGRCRAEEPSMNKNLGKEIEV